MSKKFNNGTVKKDEFLESVCELVNQDGGKELSKKDIKRVIVAAESAIKSFIKEHKQVKILDVCTLNYRHVEEKTRKVHIADGKEVTTPAHNVVTFKASKGIKELVK